MKFASTRIAEAIVMASIWQKRLYRTDNSGCFSSLVESIQAYEWVRCHCYDIRSKTFVNSLLKTQIRYGLQASRV